MHGRMSLQYVHVQAIERACDYLCLYLCMCEFLPLFEVIEQTLHSSCQLVIVYYVLERMGVFWDHSLQNLIDARIDDMILLIQMPLWIMLIGPILF